MQKRLEFSIFGKFQPFLHTEPFGSERNVVKNAMLPRNGRLKRISGMVSQEPMVFKPDNHWFPKS